MNREFLDLYNTELRLLNEQAREFADEYPGVAERLGGILEDRIDPLIGGLLEGAAFLAARVQLKLKHEFPEFTNNLLEQLVPHYLAPTPSMMMVKVNPTFGDAALRDGHAVARGSYLDAAFRQLDRQISCRFRLCSDITIWPFQLTGAEYFSSPAPLQALGVSVGREVMAGMRLTLSHRSTARPEDEPSDLDALKKPELLFAGCRTVKLPLYFTGPEADSVALYEQIFAHCKGVWFRWLDEFGDPVVRSAPAQCLHQIGFEREDALFPNDQRVFEGFDLLREFFTFPRKFLGCNLTRLDEALPQIRAKTVDILFSFDEVNARLATAVRPEMFGLYAAPAINLFEKTTDRIPLKSSQHEYQVVPDRSHYLDYEPHRLLDVYAHYPGGREKVRVEALYSASLEAPPQRSGLYFTVRRLPRRRTVEEKRIGLFSDYTGTDMFISLSALGGTDDDAAIAELSVRALCSNRHLTEHLPIGEGGADLRLVDDLTLDLVCVAGPTLPREPIISQLRSRSETAHTGTVTWRLVNMLSTNHLGLVERGAGRNAQALRETLSMFADMNDAVTERRITGVRKVDSRPIVRRVRQHGGAGLARGIEITVTIDEKLFEGTGVFLLGAVLERYFAEYSGFNHFTQTVIRSVERGEIMRWPPRMGLRRPL
ncbi:type VI secretion system baseplate subunit TssF [Bradyrhizobium jicamae]|uniref:Type VI secretion system baseplate subunit TssF n=1 Tax=Bradyrhizobium jicamae TaxID=280332 RepID=A0ABS5FVC9_9BRAD|nr:type VI secretion system baseplate subunit TssF [Bradyrhizobium jicamae]MBR0800728.1 type VI secretion system baseplate subunit TssF [Bradyrhizobium jicamae]MBR0936604.1 type VI secretion system baseplate subunit TssF [Bradyrhizobium jicamae]